MYRAHADYHHRPYKKPSSGSDIFFTCAKWYIVLFTAAHISAWLTNQRFFQFDYINIYGVHSVDVKEIDSIARKQFDNNFLYFWRTNNRTLYPTSKIQKEIGQYSSRFEKVELVLNRKNVNIYVKEYEPKIRYCLTALNRADANSLEINNPSKPIENDSTTSEQLATTTNDGFVIIPKKGEEELGLKEVPLTDGVEVNSHDCYWADDNSYVFARSPQYSGLPIFTVIENDPLKSKTLEQDNTPIGKVIFDKAKYENIKAIVSGLNAAGLHVTQAENLTNDDIALDVGFPWVVLMNTTRNQEDSVDNLLLALKELKISSTTPESRIKQIDVRFGNKVFYK